MRFYLSLNSKGPHTCPKERFGSILKAIKELHFVLIFGRNVARASKTGGCAGKGTENEQ